MIRFRVLVLRAVMVALSYVPRLALGQEATETPLAPPGGEPPTVLVSHDVGNVYLQGAKVWFWYDLPCITGYQEEEAAGELRLAEIARIATTGGITRTVWFHEGDPSCSVAAEGESFFDDELLSNVVADEENLYWMSVAAGGLAQLSVEANPGDPATPLYTGQSRAGEIEDRGDFVYLADSTYGIIKVNKTTGDDTPLVGAGTAGINPHDLQISDEMIFWNSNDGLRYATTDTGDGTEIADNVSAFVAENALCPEGGPCVATNYVFIAQNGNIRRYNVDLGTLAGVLYNSPAADAVITDIRVDATNLYWFERRSTSCEPFCEYLYSLWRMDRTGGTPELLYISAPDPYGITDPDLALGGPDNHYLYWTDKDEAEEGTLKRLPIDAAEIPSVDVDITAIDVNQAIQDLDNSIELIQDKRTGVRVHVEADGQDVQGVTAELYRVNASGDVLDGPLLPRNGNGFLTVPDQPDRATFDHAFYFELPRDWVDDATLRLRATVNPILLPPEPNYDNNTDYTDTFTMRESPTLKTHLIVWGYTVDDVYYLPDMNQDVYQAKSWIMRTYPLASTPGGYDSPDPGFRLSIRTINDPNLGDYVMQTSAECLSIAPSIREFCAAGYANIYAQELRMTEAIPENELIYGMIWHEQYVLPFPRGYADGNVSAGPTGPKTYGWDNDGSSGDWYMGHEVGHNVGRKHPADENADVSGTEEKEGCGHSPADPNVPYDHTEIGEGAMWGLDVGDIGLNSKLPPRVYSNDTWTDMMGYCDYQWISDYTYNGIYDFLAAPRPTVDPTPARAGESYISIFGSIDADDTPNGHFGLVGLWDNPGPYAPPTGTAYAMRFVDAANTTLASYDFDGNATDGNESYLGYSVVVPFPAETRTLQIVDKATGNVIGTHVISAAAPTVGNVALVNPPTPVTGMQTLEWTASDPDGDALSFDVYYSADGGATYTAFALGVSNTSVAVDTSTLPGSTTGVFRVIAGDGTRRAEAQSIAYRVAHKAPSVRFLDPQEGVEVRYGTQVNFTVDVQDLQGHVPDANIEWLINGEVVSGAAGPFFTAEMLPVGENTVAVRARNVQGLTTTQSVTVVVNDDTHYPGPLLIAGPDQMGWHLGAGSTTAAPKTLTIGNSGTGTIAWTATENVPWLSLSTTSGSNAGTITLTADPTQVTPGVATSTVITIQGENGQTVEVPVSLLVGVNEAWFPPVEEAPDTDIYLYLPLVGRE